MTPRGTTFQGRRDPPVQPRLYAAMLSVPQRQTRAFGAIGWTPNVATGEGPRSRTHVFYPRPKTSNTEEYAQKPVTDGRIRGVLAPFGPRARNRHAPHRSGMAHG